MDNKYEEQLSTAPLKKLLFRMALPAIAAQIVNLFYNIIDRIYIGHIPNTGTDALAGVGITTSIVILIAAFSAIVGGGGAPLASIALGQGDRERSKAILGNGFTLLLLFSILLSIICYISMEKLLIIAGASPNTLPYAIDYLSIYLLGTFFVQISTGLNAFINAQGRPQIAMGAIITGAILNIILDPIFIFGFNLGVKGAAIATVISEFISASWILLFLSSKKATLKLDRKYIYPKLKILIPILTLGMSPFIMASTESLIGFVLNSQLSIYGDVYVSALAIMQSAILFTSAPLVGFAQGFVPIASYNYGHGNIKRVKECFYLALCFMFSFNFILTLLMIIFPGKIGEAFTNNTYLLNKIIDNMPLFLIGMTIFGLQRACQNMFVALGQAKISIFIALLRKVLLLIPLAYLLPVFWGVKGVFAAEAISDGTAAICCTLLFFYFFPKILRKKEAEQNQVMIK